MDSADLEECVRIANRAEVFCHRILNLARDELAECKDDEKRSKLTELWFASLKSAAWFECLSNELYCDERTGSHDLNDLYSLIYIDWRSELQEAIAAIGVSMSTIQKLALMKTLMIKKEELV